MKYCASRVQSNLEEKEIGRQQRHLMCCAVKIGSGDQEKLSMGYDTVILPHLIFSAVRKSSSRTLSRRGPSFKSCPRLIRATKLGTFEQVPNVHVLGTNICKCETRFRFIKKNI
jgi:hypothetical protein